MASKIQKALKDYIFNQSTKLNDFILSAKAPENLFANAYDLDFVSYLGTISCSHKESLSRYWI